MSKRSASMLVTAANGLSVTRLLSTPVLVWLVWQSQQVESSRYAAFWLVVILQLGDALDGHLGRTGSRTLAVRNYFGEVIDPIADKLYIGASFVTLALTNQILGWFVLLVIARDAAIIAGWSLVYKRYGVRLLPNVPGKLTDGACAALLATVLLNLDTSFVATLMQVTAALILYSGYSYGRMAINAVASVSLRRLRASDAAMRRGSRRLDSAPGA